MASSHYTECAALFVVYRNTSFHELSSDKLYSPSFALASSSSLDETKMGQMDFFPPTHHILRISAQHVIFYRGILKYTHILKDDVICLGFEVNCTRSISLTAHKMAYYLVYSVQCVQTNDMAT